MSILPTPPLPDLTPGDFHEFVLEFNSNSVSGMKYGGFEVKSNDSNYPIFSLNLEGPGGFRRSWLPLMHIIGDVLYCSIPEAQENDRYYGRFYISNTSL